MIFLSSIVSATNGGTPPPPAITDDEEEETPKVEAKPLPEGKEGKFMEDFFKGLAEMMKKQGFGIQDIDESKIIAGKPELETGMKYFRFTGRGIPTDYPPELSDLLVSAQMDIDTLLQQYVGRRKVESHDGSGAYWLHLLAATGRECHAPSQRD